MIVSDAARRLAPKAWKPSPMRLSMTDREEIRAGLERGGTVTTIAGSIGRAISTVSREVASNCGRTEYRATDAHCSAERRARRPKPGKLVAGPVAGPLRDKVVEGLEKWWSPEEIAWRLRIEFADDPMMQVSHETI